MVVSTALNFPITTLVGYQKRINTYQAEKELDELWQTLFSNKQLQNNVNWSKGHVTLYTYYSNFSDDFSHVTVAIGYDSEDLQLNNKLSRVELPSGKTESYMPATNINTVDDGTWAKAYANDNMIERRELNKNGEQIDVSVFIIKQRT